MYDIDGTQVGYKDLVEMTYTDPAGEVKARFTSLPGPSSCFKDEQTGKIIKPAGKMGLSSTGISWGQKARLAAGQLALQPLHSQSRSVDTAR